MSSVNITKKTILNGYFQVVSKVEFLVLITKIYVYDVLLG